ncbi:hypothetical protein ACH5RR_030729 [Cinchona calisaya]|uniref:Cyclin-dependent protein kinase inhibitor SMR6 n=1 Tax=Cinchona calisaya TaxID=153742 RepID=A0ABD2YWL4_9GENT
MGLNEMDVEAKKWIIAGIALRSPLKPIFTKKENDTSDIDDQEEEEYCICTTPTSQESRIPARLTCPPAPKKRKASSRSCNFSGVKKEFFNPPDLETVFIIRRAEKS